MLIDWNPKGTTINFEDLLALFLESQGKWVERIEKLMRFCVLANVKKKRAFSNVGKFEDVIRFLRSYVCFLHTHSLWSRKGECRFCISDFGHRLFWMVEKEVGWLEEFLIVYLLTTPLFFIQRREAYTSAIDFEKLYLLLFSFWNRKRSESKEWRILWGFCGRAEAKVEKSN